MADIFADTSPQYFRGEGSSGVTRFTGDEDTDKYLNSLPPEKRAEALKRLTAPLTGEELAEKAKDPNFTMDREQYSRFVEFKKTEDKGILDDIGMLAEGGMHIFEQIYKTASSVKDHPLESLAKLGPSGVEALWQGTRNMYGMVAQSSDPTSKFFRFKAALMGEDTDQGYNQYLEARQFNRESIELAEGKRTILVNKDYIDHEMTQAMSYIADPSLFVPFAKIGGLGLRAIGMGEKAALLAARAGAIKSRIIGGTLKYAIGKPIEFIGGATRGIIDYGITTGALATEAVTGMSAREVAQTVRMGSLGTTAASLAGHSAPIISDVSNAYIAGGAAQGLGQALGAIGGQMQRGPRGFISYAKAALEADKAILSPHAQNLLKIINAADPLLSLTADVAKGSSHGLLIGAGLGYGNAGYEGMWQGAGAGMALGGVGGLAGGMLSRATGAKTIERADITAKYAIEGAKQTGKFHQASSWEFLRKIGEMTGTKPMMDGIVAAFDSLAPDSRYIFRNNKEHNTFLDTNGFDRKTGRHKTDPNAVGQISEFHHINMEGVVMQVDKSGQWTMHINTEKLFSQKNGKFRAGTVPHEMLHLILRKAVLTPHFLENLKHDILGVRAANGKLLEAGSVNPEETRQFFREYMKRMYNDVDKAKDPTGHANEAKRLSDLADKAIDEYVKTGTSTFSDSVIGSNRPLLEHLTEEFGAYYFQELVGAKSPDFLYFAGKYEGIRGVMDRVTNRFVDHWESKRSALDPLFSFKEGKSLSEGFRDASGKRIRVGSIDYMISDFLKMTQNQNRTGRVDLTLMSDKARGELILRKGLDDLGRARGARDPRRRSLSEDTQLGKAIHAELLAINPSRTTDGAGNLVGHLSDADLAGLVRAGHISDAMAQKIRTLQNLASNPDKPVFEAGYWGATHTAEVGPNAQRVTGDEVPFTNRKGVLLDVNIKIGKNGKVSMVARTLDLRVNAERANNMWANPAVRDLWNGNADLYKADYIKYLTNMGKDVAGGKIETSLLLDNGDGKGGQRRDIMHQIAGVPLGAGDVYVNHPIGEIHSDALNALTHLSIGRMQDIRLTGEAVLGFDPKNAIPDIGRNFSPSDMAYKETPNGKIWEHKSGYRFHQLVDGQTVAYDRRGERIGSYATPEQAMLAGRQKLQAQQKALHEVAQDVKKAYDRGVHFSPRDEWARKQATEEFHGYGWASRLREDYVAMLHSLTEEYNAKVNDPRVDPRLLRGIKNKMELIPKIIEGIDSKTDLFSAEMAHAVQHAGIPVPANPDPVIKISAGQAWLSMNAGGLDKYTAKWDKMFPMTFRSALNDRIQQILKTKPNITAQQLRKQLLQYGSRTGERLWAEAEAIGFVDWLESKIEPTYILTRRKDANGVLLPRGEEHQPILKQKGVRDSAPLDPKEITDFLKNNGLSIKIDTGAKSINVSNTSYYTFGGTKAGYNETPIRINEAKYHHGVTGHYGPDTIVHTRKTIRFDSEGNKYIYIEEVQSNNAEGKPLQHRLYNDNELAVAKRNVARLKKEVALIESLRAEQQDYEARSLTIDRLETYHHAEVAEALGSKKVKEWQSPNRPPDVTPWEEKHKSIRKVAKETEAFILANPDVVFSHLVDDSRLVNGRLPDDYVVFRTRRTPSQMVDMFGNPNPDINITFGEFKQLLKENPDIFTRIAEERVGKKVWSADSAIKVKIGDKVIDFNQEFYPVFSGRNSKMRLSTELLNTFQDISGSIRDTLLDTYHRPEWGSGYRPSLGKTYGEYRANKLSPFTRYSGITMSETAWRFNDEVNKAFIEGAPTEFRAVYEARQKVKQGLRDYVWETLTPEQKLHEYNGKKENLLASDARMFRLEDIDTQRADLADLESNLQKDSLLRRRGTKQQPLQELYDRARIALLELAAYSIREGVDTLVLTHPDDAPTVSMMKYDARTGFYGKALPQVWAGIIAKYGMEVKTYDSTERFLKGVDVAKIPEIKQRFKTLSDASNETFAKCKALLDMYETGVAVRITDENVTFITQTTSRPIHEVTTPRRGQPDFEGQVNQTISSLSKRVRDGEIPKEFLDAYVEAIDAKRAESKAFEEMVQRVQDEQSNANSKTPMSRDEIITAMGLSRGKHIVMNEKFKADVMSGKLLTTFSVAEKDSRGGGRTYDFASDMFRKSFIGRYYNENKDKLPQGLTINMGQIHHKIGDPNFGFTLAIEQGTTASGKPKQVAYINANVTGDQAYVSSTGVAESMRGNKLNDVLMSELAERVRAMGVKYIDGVIIDPVNRPYHARMRTIGNADTIAGAYYDTTRSTLDPTAYYSVGENDKGGRTYDTRSLKWKKGFLGRYASENPEMTKEVKLSFQTEKVGNSGRPAMSGGIGGKVTHNHYLQITEAGKEVGHITWKSSESADGRKYFYDPSVSVEPQYQGKKFQHLLYSEAAERARAMGATDFFQRIENDLGLPLKSQVRTFGENYSRLLDQLSGQYLPATMENFNKLKYPEMFLEKTNPDGTKTEVSMGKGHELWVFAWSKMKSDAWYAINERDALVLRKSDEMPWFKKALDELNGFVKYATAEDLNELRGLHAVSHGPDTLSGTDITTVGGERVLEGAGGMAFPMLEMEKGSNLAWASQGDLFVGYVNRAVQANAGKGKGNTAIMPLVFTKFDKVRASVQGSEAYYNLFNILKRGKIVSETDLRLAMLDAVEMVRTETDKKTGNKITEHKQTAELKKIVRDNKMNWDEMLANVMLTLDDKGVQNFGTRPYMLDDFMGAIWERVMKNLSDKKKQEVMRFFPEWDASQTKNEFTLANFKNTMGKTLADSLTKGLKSGDVYAIIKFNDFVKAEPSSHRSYDTGVVQKNGQRPQMFLLKKPINVMDLHETSVSASSGERKLSDLPPSIQTNLLGMNTNPYGRTILKDSTQVDFRDIMKNMAVAENFKEKVTPSGKVIQAINGYIIMMQGDKFKVYNGQKVQVGIYASEEEAKKRVLRDNRR